MTGSAEEEDSATNLTAWNKVTEESIYHSVYVEGTVISSHQGLYVKEGEWITIREYLT
jgi:hypothetical protein